MIDTGEIILVFDENTRPPKPKLVVCVCPNEGMFFRINTHNHWPDSVLIDEKSHPGALEHDSYVSCSGPMELDDTVIDEAIRRHGVLGRVAPAVMAEVCKACNSSRQISARDKKAISDAIQEAYDL